MRIILFILFSFSFTSYTFSQIDITGSYRLNNFNGYININKDFTFSYQLGCIVQKVFDCDFYWQINQDKLVVYTYKVDKTLQLFDSIKIYTDTFTICNKQDNIYFIDGNCDDNNADIWK